MTGPIIPSRDMLDAIEAGGASESIFRRHVPPYSLSVVYRMSSAVIESPGWYPESMIFRGEWKRDEAGRLISPPTLVYQGEGWGELHALYPLTSAAAVEEFIRARAAQND